MTDPQPSFETCNRVEGCSLLVAHSGACLPSFREPSQEMWSALHDDLHRAVIENDRLRGALTKYADAVERDRYEPDKMLCNALSMRRAAQQ